MTGYTPGPWTVDRHGTAYYPLRVVAGNREVVAFHAWDDEKEANARLIAAAPELLEALKAALPGLRREYVELAQKYAGTKFESDHAYREVEARYRNAQAAIAKAERSPT